MQWNDQNTTIEQMKHVLGTFNEEREWGQFHGPRNLAMALNVESGELLECFLWSQDDGMAVIRKNRKAVEDEAADVLISLINFCSSAGINLAAVTQRKIKENAQKYPVELARGRSDKHTQLRVKD